MTIHVCQCEGPCSCGRPKPRLSGAEVGQARSRLARLEAQATLPTDDDYQFVANGRFDNAADGRTAGKILTRWINAGHLGAQGFGPDSRKQGTA